MKSTQDFRRNSDFRENDTHDLIATTVIGGATWWTPPNNRVHRSIVYAFNSNMTGGATWRRPYIHTHLVDLVYKFE